MAKQVLGDLRTSAQFPTKLAKRPRNDDDETVSLMKKQPVDAAVATKRQACNAAAVGGGVPRPVSSHQPRSNCVVTHSEMMAFFALLGTVDLSPETSCLGYYLSFLSAVVSVFYDSTVAGKFKSECMYTLKQGCQMRIFSKYY